MNLHLLELYVAAVFLAMIAPGPDMLFILATGTRGGPRAGVLATLGVVTSEVVQITAVAAVTRSLGVPAGCPRVAGWSPARLHGAPGPRLPFCATD